MTIIDPDALISLYLDASAGSQDQPPTEPSAGEYKGRAVKQSKDNSPTFPFPAFQGGSNLSAGWEFAKTNGSLVDTRAAAAAGEILGRRATTDPVVSTNSVEAAPEVTSRGTGPIAGDNTLTLNITSIPVVNPAEAESLQVPHTPFFLTPTMIEKLKIYEGISLVGRGDLIAEILTIVDGHIGALPDTLILEVVEAASALEELALDGLNRLTPYAFRQLAAVFPNVHTLYMGHMGISDVHLQFLNGFPNLQKLDIAGCKISRRGIAAIGAQCRRLKSLRMDYAQGLTEKDVRALKWLHRLEVLQLGRVSAVTDDSISALGDLAHLKYLDIPSSRLTNRGVRAIAQFIGPLEKLDISQNEWITDISPLRKLPTLDTLYTTDLVPDEQRCKWMERSFDHYVMPYPVGDFERPAKVETA